jgi:hypothetical protein
MKLSRFSEAQNVGILKKVDETYCKHVISAPRNCG